MISHTTSIIGLSKNAGKTTLLNHLIYKYDLDNTKIGLTSIGIDGEREDFITGKPKPPINVPEGTLVATTAQGLAEGTGEWRILADLNINTSMGEIYLAEAIQSGTLKLVGIPMIESVITVVESFKKYGAKKILLDGAYDRMSTASPMVTDEAYLVVGASLNQNESVFWKLVEERLQPFFYQIINENDVIKTIKSKENKLNILIQINKTWVPLPSAYLLNNENDLPDGINRMYLPGVLTESMLSKMLLKNKGWHIILEHGLKSFVSSGLFGKWKKKGGTIQVLHPIKIKGIAYNPYASEGYSFKATEMEQNIIRILKSLNHDNIPVFDVWREEINWR